MSFGNFRGVTLALAVGMAGLSAGCGGGHTPAPGRVYAVDAPPAERVEVRGAPPSGAWVWIPGHYRWQVPDYVWQGGHWDRIPRGRKRWEPGHWAHVRRGWYWVEGRWR